MRWADYGMDPSPVRPWDGGHCWALSAGRYRPGLDTRGGRLTSACTGRRGWSSFDAAPDGQEGKTEEGGLHEPSGHLDPGASHGEALSRGAEDH